MVDESSVVGRRVALAPNSRNFSPITGIWLSRSGGRHSTMKLQMAAGPRLLLLLCMYVGSNNLEPTMLDFAIIERQAYQFFGTAGGKNK